MNRPGARRNWPGIGVLRQRLQAGRGREFWRSLEELAQTAEFEEYLYAEFPAAAESWLHSMDRRQMLKLMGASFALAAMTACSSPPPEKIVPYVSDVPDFVPGHPVFYATAMPLGGFGKGVLVETHMGRPTKVEGNPQHPDSLGATDSFTQASILSLYDPDRSRAVSSYTRIGSWTAFNSAFNAQLEHQSAKKGAGLRILTETISSPTLGAQLQSVLARFPAAQWHQYEPAGDDNQRAGAQLAFGQYANTCYRTIEADVILALDSDFLTQGPGWIAYARDWAARRQRGSPRGMNRLYAAESTPTATGAIADHRLKMRSSEVQRFALAVAKAVGVDVPPGTPPPGADPKWVSAVARDLLNHRGRSLVAAGAYQPAPVHALAHGMNDALGNTGKTVFHTDPVESNPVPQVQSLRQLADDMQKGKVEVLVILSGNPVYTSPADVDFRGALARVPFSVHLGVHEDETAASCTWHVPEAHYLESWGDVRAFDGTVTIMQPATTPLYGGHSALELLAAMQGNSGAAGRDLVNQFWQARHPSGDFDDFWQASLQAGIIDGSALPPKDLAYNPEWTRHSPDKAFDSPPALEVIFRPDPTIHDGRFANNGWLQELPKPLTKLTWDNAALMSPGTAERLGLDVGELMEDHPKGRYETVVELEYRSRKVEAPVWVLPGHPDNAVTVHLGYGRTRAGNVGTGKGFDAYALRGSDAPWFDTGLSVTRKSGTRLMATTQNHHSMAGRDLVRVMTPAEFETKKRVRRESPAPNETLFHNWPYPEYKWGMTVNLGSCVGCNACIAACNAENNIPVVGKEQTGLGREMQWLRVDRYYQGDLDNPKTYFEPVLCMHCETAPCELVCPTQATNHSSEGLNQMVYNRCVGTRYCSNNCPYKVRRFNFLQYSDYITPSLQPMRNPDVTVRSRGVMEKCTYCVQRIQEAKIRASEENRAVKDGEIMTACQQACPTRVFVFGDLNDAASQVSRAAADPLTYGLLEELNTRPRTTYLAKLRNPNPELEPE